MENFYSKKVEKLNKWFYQSNVTAIERLFMHVRGLSDEVVTR